MRTSPAIASLLFALAPAVALANGGPVDGNAPSGIGGVQPVLDRDVRLVEEELTLTLAADGAGYRADARYVLSNPKGARTVTFGVPVAFFGEMGEAPSAAPDAKQLAALARGIRIEVAGKPFACTIVPGAAPARGAPPLAPVATQSEPYQEVAAWCVARVALPQGDAIPLALAYAAQMAFTDWESSKSALRTYEPRRLRYALFPAGYWAGPPSRVRIRLEAGPFEGLVAATPPPSRTEGAALVWDLERPDLAKLGSLVATVDVEPVLRHRELLALQAKRGPRAEAGVLRAKASSVLAPQGKVAYGAEKAVDGDAATAWCEGKAGAGVGEWIEVRLVAVAADGKESRPEACPSLQGVALVPGYAKSAGAWTGNGRLRAFRLGPCGRADGGKVLRLEGAGGSRSRTDGPEPLRLSDRFDRSAVLVPVELGEADDPFCVRLTILEVEKGKTDDTCISELRPIYNCG